MEAAEEAMGVVTAAAAAAAVEADMAAAHHLGSRVSPRHHRDHPPRPVLHLLGNSLGSHRCPLVLHHHRRGTKESGQGRFAVFITVKINNSAILCV